MSHERELRRESHYWARSVQIPKPAAFLLIWHQPQGTAAAGGAANFGALGTEGGEKGQRGQCSLCRQGLKAAGGVSSGAQGAGRRPKAAGQLVAAGRDQSQRAPLLGRRSRESPGLSLSAGPRPAIWQNPLSSQKMGSGAAPPRSKLSCAFLPRRCHSPGGCRRGHVQLPESFFRPFLDEF